MNPQHPSIQASKLKASKGFISRALPKRSESSYSEWQSLECRQIPSMQASNPLVKNICVWCAHWLSCHLAADAAGKVLQSCHSGKNLPKISEPDCRPLPSFCTVWASELVCLFVWYPNKQAKNWWNKTQIIKPQRSHCPPVALGYPRLFCFVCLFVWWYKTWIVKPLGRFHFALFVCLFGDIKPE